MDFRQKIKTFTQKYDLLRPGMGVLVGLSGGADSVALLEALCGLREELDLKLAAVHVHHGIRETAEHDAVFCKMLCKQKGVDFVCEKIDVPALASEKGLSVEEAGREARYEIFERIRKEKNLDVIAVAHHKNDQAETMLFQLFRGSGLRGLSGIPFKRDAIIRPLMDASREEVEAFIESEGLLYMLDSTNASDDYSRNKIRHHVVPQAEEIAASAVENMSRAALLLREVEDYMKAQSDAFMAEHAECLDGQTVISVKALEQCHIALQKAVIMIAISQTIKSRRDLTEKHVESVLSLIEKDGEKAVSLPQGYIARKQYDKLILAKEETPGEDAEGAPKSQSVVLGEKVLFSDGTWLEATLLEEYDLNNIPSGDSMKWFDYDKIEHTLCVRTRQQGDFLTIDEHSNKKSLQDYLVNEKVPKSSRDQCLLLADGNHIMWVLGKRISTHYKVSPNTTRILQIHIGG